MIHQDPILKYIFYFDKCFEFLSQMFLKVAKYFFNKKEFDIALRSLDQAEKLSKPRQGDVDVWIKKAEVFLENGSFKKSLHISEQILKQKGKSWLSTENCHIDKYPGLENSSVATLLKGQSLFNLCHFEHALIMFHRGDKLNLHSHTFR